MTTAKTLATVARSGNRLETLRSLRGRLARQIDDVSTSPRDLAALSLRLIDVLAEIAEIEKTLPRPKGTPLDELAKRRAGKTPASSSGGTTRGRVRRR